MFERAIFGVCRRIASTSIIPRQSSSIMLVAKEIMRRQQRALKVGVGSILRRSRSRRRDGRLRDCSYIGCHERREKDNEGQRGGQELELHVQKNRVRREVEEQ